MQDYVKLTLRENPNQIITHVGANDLASYKRPEQIAGSIIGVTSSLKSDTCDALISGITEKRSNRKKVTEVDIVLTEICKEKKTLYIMK